ncbi:MAG TPA: hypothetical protein VJS44_07460 [Pyrinomonadaceae bacterium]|nr:hypothetical protein [Pyrinomonadaceae bacterium]
MYEELEARLNFLRACGAGTLRHSGGTLIAHLLGTRTLLQAWQARPALYEAGLFHSVYGTESFGDGVVALELRPAVREVIGEEAEELVFLFGIKKSRAFYTMARGVIAGLELKDGRHARAREAATSELQIEHRLTGERLAISRQQLGDLINLSIANTLEQAYRSQSSLNMQECEFLFGLSRLALPGATRALRCACRRAGSN